MLIKLTDKKSNDKLLPYARDLFEDNGCDLDPKEPFFGCDEIPDASDKCNLGRRADIAGFLSEGRSFAAETISISEYDEENYSRNQDQFSAIDCNKDVGFAVIKSEEGQWEDKSKYLKYLGYTMAEKPTFTNKNVSAYEVEREQGKCFSLKSGKYFFS